MGEKLADLGRGRVVLLLRFLISLKVTGPLEDAPAAAAAEGLGLNSLVQLGVRDALGVMEALLQINNTL